MTKPANIYINPHRLTQKQVAELFTVTTRTVRNWTAAPRNSDGSYSLSAVIAWRLELERGNQTEDGVLLSAMSPQDKARLLKARADREEHAAALAGLQVAERTGELVPLTELEDAADAAAVPLRAFGEQLQQQDPKMAEQYRAALDKAVATLLKRT